MSMPERGASSKPRNKPRVSFSSEVIDESFAARTHRPRDQSTRHSEAANGGLPPASEATSGRQSPAPTAPVSSGHYTSFKPLVERVDCLEPTTGTQNVFTHHTNGPQPGFGPQLFGNLGGFVGPVNQPTFGYPVPRDNFIRPTVGASMGDYQNADTPRYGVHFQPQVPDTTAGPYTHQFIPRHDQGGIFTQSCQYGQPVQYYPVPMPVSGANVNIHSQFASFVVGSLVGPSSFMVGQGPYPPPLRSAFIQTGGVAVPMHGAQIPMTGAAFGPMPGAHPVIMQQPAPVGMMGATPMTASAAAPVIGHCQPGMVPMPMPMPMPGQQPIVAGNSYPEPATGLGMTASEMQAHYAAMEADPENKINEPQDFKPADDDNARMYYVRELDGNWTLRSRWTIDNLGDCRWYIMDNGAFYAVRLPN